MHLRTKLIITYSVLIILLALILGNIYNRYNYNQYKKREYDSLQMITDNISNQFEEIVKPMEYISEYLLSDMEVLDALNTLAITDPSCEFISFYTRNAKRTIKKKLDTYYLINNFYRVLVYNSNGHVISNKNYGNFRINEEFPLENLEWLEQVKNQKGKPVLIGVRKDEWGISNKEEVFSIVKEVQGMEMGYIEVQQSAADLEKIFNVTRKDTDVIALQADGSVLYSNLDLSIDMEKYYASIAENMNLDASEIKNPFDNEIDVICGTYSENTGVTVLLVTKKQSIKEAISFTTPATVFIIAYAVMASLIYIYLTSIIITRPLEQLKVQMEETRLGKINNNVTYDSSNDEITALNKCYQEMLQRLNEAVIKEKQRHALQLQSQYDILQAQVNPHFIYNVLNIISYRGVKNNDEVICDMCYSLASMLRYSTNNKNRESSIAEEIDYLEKYFYLLKMRFEHKLEYEISIEESIKTQLIPKIVLQQLVENSVNHGFNYSNDVMKIKVTGWQEDKWWYIKVSDNGQGFTKEKIKELKAKMAETKSKLISGDSNIELSIGGMGLISTYARLLLIYEEDLIFRYDRDNSYTSVVIGAKMKDIGDLNV